MEKKISRVRSLQLFPPPSPNRYRNYLASRNALTGVIAGFFEIEKVGKLFRKHASAHEMKTCWYLKIINSLFPQLASGSVQRLKSVLMDDETISSFLFELDIATHFFRRGLDVRFADLEDIGRFDLLVSDGNSELEVECKTKTADAGRKITRANFALLCDLMTAELAPLRDHMAVLFKCDGRLSGSQDFFYQVAEHIKSCRARQQTIGRVGNLNFDMRSLPAGIRIRTGEEMIAARPADWPDSHFFCHSGPDTTLMIGCESTDKDRVLKAIYEDLKHGAEQLSGTRPSILACRLEDIDDEQDMDTIKGDGDGCTTDDYSPTSLGSMSITSCTVQIKHLQLQWKMSRTSPEESRVC